MLVSLMRSGRVAAIALSLLFCAAGTFWFWSTARSTAAIDFYQMRAGARMARESASFYEPATGARMGEIYRREAVAAGATRRHVAAATYRRNLEIFSTPFLYTLYAPLRGPYERDLLIFHSITFLALGAWVAIFARLFRWPPAGALLLFAFLLIAFEPVRSDITVGNSNQIILAIVAVAAAFTSKQRFAAAGAALALATAAKPHVALIFPVTYLFWAAARRWRDLVRHATGAAGGAAVAVAAGSAYFESTSIWLEWIAALRALPESIVPVDIGNFALVLLLRSTRLPWLAALPFVAAAAALAFIAVRRGRDARFDVPLIALGCVLFHLVSRLVWLHYFTLAVPLAMWLLRPADGAPATRRQVAGAASLLLIAVRPWDAFVPTVFHVAALVNTGLLILLAAAIAAALPRPSEQSR